MAVIEEIIKFAVAPFTNRIIAYPWFLFETESHALF